MPYIQKVIDLVTHYPYPYNVCYYVYTACGNKAEEILRFGAEEKIPYDQIMMLSDLCYHAKLFSLNNEEGSVDSLKRNLVSLNRINKEVIQLTGKRKCICERCTFFIPGIEKGTCDNGDSVYYQIPVSKYNSCWRGESK